MNDVKRANLSFEPLYLQIVNSRKSYVVCILLENLYILHEPKSIYQGTGTQTTTKDVINVHQTMTDVTLK